MTTADPAGNERANRRVAAHSARRRRWLFVAVLLASVFGAVLIWQPWRTIALHPLHGRTDVDLCDRLPSPSALPSAADAEGDVEGDVEEESGTPLAISSADDLSLGCVYYGRRGAILLSVLLVNQSMAPMLDADVVTSAASRALFDTWLDEARANGAQPLAQSGPWRSASSYRRDDEHHLLIEDDGVVLWLFSTPLSDAALLDYARRAAPALRSD